VENFQGKKLEFDFSNSRIWDETAVTKVLEIKNQLEQEGVHVTFTGLDLQSQQLLERLTPIK
ncbi:MAG: sulfate permease, partial [Kurthia sp.]|nr:sulfate permease [Kurthia sp.]